MNILLLSIFGVHATGDTVRSIDADNIRIFAYDVEDVPGESIMHATTLRMHATMKYPAL